MSHELFTEVPIEQQETISGGFLNSFPFASGASINFGETSFAAAETGTRVQTRTLPTGESTTDSQTIDFTVVTSGRTFNIIQPFSFLSNNSNGNGGNGGNGSNG
ncbi:hypothetical protein [Nodularia chucula]|uniref:hypothetical protein n=1 Tax=Nodularia chucula TaxID=3093667 RepID=UPI0039C6A317